MDDKTKWLERMQEFDETTLSAAYFYAKYLSTYGVDVSKEWKTVAENSVMLEKAYRRGYYTALSMMLNSKSESKEEDKV